MPTKRAESHEPVYREDDDLPEGWANCTVTGIFELIRGVSYEKGEAKDRPDAGLVPILRANNINGEINHNDLQYVPKARVSAHQMLRTGDVVIAMSSGSKTVVGKAALMREPWDGSFGAFCGVLRPTAGLDQDYLGYFFQTMAYRQAISEQSAGVNINNLKRQHFEQTLIPIAPLREQHRIVDKVEALLARLNAARARLARAPALLKAFRQAVLSSACSGKLTGEWREANAGSPDGKSLLAQIVGERRVKIEGSSLWHDFRPLLLEEEREDYPQSWAVTQLGTLSTKIVDGVHKTPHYLSSGIPFVTVKNLTAGSGISLEALNYISEEDHEEFVKRANPEKGDLLITKDGTLGVVRAVRTEAKFSLFVSVAMIKPVLKEMTDYLEIALSSDQVQRRLIHTGSGLQHIHLRDLKSVPVPLPPLPEQHEIVRRVEALFALADAIEAKVAAAQKRADALTQAILAKAFRGELVPTEASLARAQGRPYESAGDMISRLMEKREVKPAGGRRETPR